MILFCFFDFLRINTTTDIEKKVCITFRQYNILLSKHIKIQWFSISVAVLIPKRSKKKWKTKKLKYEQTWKIKSYCNHLHILKVTFHINYNLIQWINTEEGRRMNVGHISCPNILFNCLRIEILFRVFNTK